MSTYDNKELHQIKLPFVILSSGHHLAVDPHILKALGLKPGQKVDDETMKKILDMEN